jgi:hypothetical protein
LCNAPDIMVLSWRFFSHQDSQVQRALYPAAAVLAGALIWRTVMMRNWFASRNWLTALLHVVWIAYFLWFCWFAPGAVFVDIHAASHPTPPPLQATADFRLGWTTTYDFHQGVPFCIGLVGLSSGVPALFAKFGRERAMPRPVMTGWRNHQSVVIVATTSFLVFIYGVSQLISSGHDRPDSVHIALVTWSLLSAWAVLQGSRLAFGLAITQSVLSAWLVA